VTVNPASLPLNAKPPPLVMQEILVDGVALTNRSDWKLEYGYRELQFRYAAASFSAPERIRFRRQLVGFDTDWVEAGPSRTAVYPRLDPGRYVFRFTARNADGVWNDDPVSLAFVVTPALWQTVWFRTVAVLAFAALVAGLVRHRYVRKMRRKVLELEQARAVEQERMRIAQDIHDDLGARLTQIAFLSEMTAGEIGTEGKAGGRMEKIAQGSRQAIRSLEEIVWAVNPRKDALPHLVDYLSHYANEFFRPTDIRCRQDLPLSIPEIPLPADIRHHLFLACKEALNNVHKHARASEVWLRLEVAEGSLTVMIEDNGVGFAPPAAASTGNGLPNLRTRLATLGGRCEIEAKPGAGTRVRMIVPLSQAAGTSATRPNSA
jgi:signal transduction histidine kinase